MKQIENLGVQHTKTILGGLMRLKLNNLLVVRRRFMLSKNFSLHFSPLFLLMVAVWILGERAIAQQPAKSPAPERPLEIVTLLGEARLAAPEIAVDTIIKVAQSKKVSEPAWRLEILEEALRLVDTVKYPVRRTVIPVKGMHVDTHSGYQSHAYDMKLDALSLKVRIINELVKVDKERARQVVFQIGGKLGLRPLKCTDTLAYDVSEIYPAVGAVAKAVFTPKEVEEGVRAQFVAAWLENIESPSQIVPALDMLAQFKGSEAEKFLLFAALSKAIDRNFKDDRSFMHSLEKDRPSHKIAKLISGVGDETLKAGLSGAYRGFLLKNFKSARCRENELKPDTQLPSYIVDANFLFTEKPVTLEDIAHSDLNEAADVNSFWRSHNAVKIRREFRELRNAKNREGITHDEWKVKYDQAMANLESWTATGDETESDVFNQKAVLLRTMFDIVPDGKMRESLTQKFVKLLDSSPLQKQSFIEWYFHARWLSGKNHEMFAAAVRSSPSANLQLLVTAKKAGF